FAADAVGELWRCLFETKEIDAKQCLRFVGQIAERDPRPPVSVGSLDGEVDVRALTMVAASAQAEQPHPGDLGVSAYLFDEAIDRRRNHCQRRHARQSSTRVLTMVLLSTTALRLARAAFA